MSFLHSSLVLEVFISCTHCLNKALVNMEIWIGCWAALSKCVPDCVCIDSSALFQTREFACLQMMSIPVSKQLDSLTALPLLQPYCRLPASRKKKKAADYESTHREVFFPAGRWLINTLGRRSFRRLNRSSSNQKAGRSSIDFICPSVLRMRPWTLNCPWWLCRECVIGGSYI